MKKRLDKVFCLPTGQQTKVYRAKCPKKKKQNVWQYLYSLFF